MTLPLVDRDASLATLRAALDDAEARRGQVVVLSGEPGVGKSALAEVIGREAEARGHQVLLGRAWELAEAPPYFPLRACLRALGIAVPEPSSEVQAFHFWETVLEALSRASGTLVFILEDLHAADLQTLDLLGFLARPLRALRVLVVVTTRDQDARIGDAVATRLARLRRDGREIHLETLAAGSVSALAQAVAGRELPPDWLRQLTEVTGGNPLFVIECARGHRPGAPVRLPASVRELTAARVAQLPPATREVLAAAAILGRDFTAGLCAAMLGRLPAQVIDHLAPALRAGLLLELRPGHFRFHHILVRDAVEDGLEPAARAELHARAEAALRTTVASGDSVDVLVERARHGLMALRAEGDPVGLALGAARKLEAQGAADRALALYQRIEDAHAAGLGPAPDADEALHRAAVARAAGRHTEARRRAEAVLVEARHARDPALLARAAFELGAELRPGTVDAGLVAALREALALLGPREGADAARLRCRLQARLSGALQPADDPEVPAAMARGAIAAARALGDDAVLREVLHHAGAALVDYAPDAERLAVDLELRERARAAGDDTRALVANARLAFDHLIVGDFARFDADLEELRALSQRLYHPRHRARCLFLESARALMRGDVELSERCLVECQQLLGLTDDPALVMALRAHELNRANLLHHDDELRAMLPQLAVLTSLVPRAELLVSSIRAAAYARLEDREATRRELIRIGARLPVGDATYLHGEACALSADVDEVRRMHAALLPTAERHLVSGHVPATYEGPTARILALLESRLGAHETAIARLTSAREAARALGHATWVAQLGYDLGRAQAAAGDPGAARALDDAATLAETLGMTGLAARARARLGAPAAPAVVADIAGQPRLQREGELWRLDHGGVRLRLRPNRGLELLARLMERPGEEIHVLTLANDGGGAGVEGDAGELLDPQARRAYGARLDDLASELDEAEAAHDLERARRLGEEREALARELHRAVGLSGRARGAASASERARVNVQRRIKDALARIAEADAALGAFLAPRVHTGTYCCFRP